MLGVFVAGLPFVLTIALFWSGSIGGSLVPFRLDDSHLRKVADYHTVFAASYSDHYFFDHQTESWDALERVCERQADFLVWNYGFLFLETSIFVLLVSFYGEWKNVKLYAWLASRVLLPAVSEWHVLLSGFTFPARDSRSIEVDALSKDNILYRGSVVDHFLGVNGELSGLLLKDAQRFQYDKLKDDRKSNLVKSKEQYWKPIPGGGSFYLPGDNIASLNIRYPLPKGEYERVLKDVVERLFKTATNVSVEAIPIMDNEAIERELTQRKHWIANWDEVKAAVVAEFQAIKERFPGLVELHDIPSRTLYIAKPIFPAATVRATMSLNGDSIVIEKSRHQSKDDIPGKEEKNVIKIDVEHDSTFYTYDGKRIGVAEIVNLILQPIRDALV